MNSIISSIFSSYNKPHIDGDWHLSSEVIDSVLYIPHFILKCLVSIDYIPNVFFCGSAHQYQPSYTSIVTISEESLSCPRNEYGFYKDQLRTA